MSELDSSDYPQMWLGDDGILRVQLGSRIKLEDAQRAHQKQLAISKKALPLLVVGGGTLHVDREADRYASSPEVVAVTLALAIVTKSALEKHLGKLFLWLMKPPYPTQLFTDEEKALSWLKQFVEEEKRDFG